VEFDPPIHTRTTNELIAIANYTEDWNEEAIEQAKAELVKRGITKEEQEKKVNEWNEIAEKEWIQELERRKVESYDWLSLIFMTIYWPRTMLYDWSLRKEGYVKKHKQRLLTITMGISIILGMVLWADLTYEASQIELQNEINNTDISEWEKGYYTEEEIAERRKQDIEKTIEKVTINNSNNTLTFVLLNSDTISNQNIESLRNLDPATIKDVIFEKYLKPEFHEIIKIKLNPAANNGEHVGPL
jgi:hypothetical protein